MKKTAYLRGFTLVEILITIAIIAVLSLVGTVVYRVVTKNAKDSANESTMNAMESGLIGVPGLWPL